MQFKGRQKYNIIILQDLDKYKNNWKKWKRIKEKKKREKKKEESPFTRRGAALLFNLWAFSLYKLRFAELASQHVLVIIWIYTFVVQGQGHGATIFRLVGTWSNARRNKSTRGCTLLGSPWVLQPLTFSRIYSFGHAPPLCWLNLVGATTRMIFTY